MTLATAIIVGLACGYLLGLRPRAGVVFGVLWIPVLVVQTFIVLDAEDVPPEAWSYVPVQVVILAIGATLMWLGARLRARLACAR
jgi:hypothetical protein